MDKENLKPWEKPWTTDEIREHSTNWNLAGDAGLLNHLKKFSQDLLAKAHSTEVALDKLVEDLEATSTAVENATNSFLFLANTQFVENRVYDDDDEKETPSEEKKDINVPKTKEELETEAFQNVKQVLDASLRILDTHFEAVEVPASDSEEDESSASVGRLVLKPKNPYSSKPLPYLIGSREFMEDDKVGLSEIFSDIEESPDQNGPQSSDSDDEIDRDEFLVPSKKPVMSSFSEPENSEPESDLGDTVAKQRRPITNNSLGAFPGEEEKDMFGQITSPEADEAAIADVFSDEISSKLAISKSDRKVDGDNLFATSLDHEEDDGLFGKVNRSFSEKPNLFDDMEDWKTDSMWKRSISSDKDKNTTDTSKEIKIEKTIDEDHPNSSLNIPKEINNVSTASKQKLPIETVEKEKLAASTPETLATPRQKKDNLFKSGEEVEDLFSENFKGAVSASAKSLFDQDILEDDLFAIPTASSSSQATPSQSAQKKKKLPGAIRVFSDVNLFGDISPVVEVSEGENASDGGSVPSVPFPQEPSSGIGASIESSKKNVGSESVDIFQPSGSGSSILKSKAKKPLSLFEDSDSGDDELLFSSTSSTSSRSRRSQGSADVLASSSEKRTLPRKDLFDEQSLFGALSKDESNIDIFSSQIESKTTKSSTSRNVSKGVKNVSEDENASRKITSSIFDDIDEVDDIFAVPKITVEKAKNTVLKSQSNLGNVTLFSDNLSETKDIFSNKIDKSKIKVEFVSQPIIDSHQITATNSNLPVINNHKTLTSEDSTSFLPDEKSKNTSEDSKSFLSDEKSKETSEEKNLTDKKPALSKKPKVPNKPTSSAISSQSFSDSLESNVPIIDKKFKGAGDSGLVNERPQGGDKVSSNGANEETQEPRTGAVTKDKSDLAVHLKPEPPRTLNIRKTTEIVFESPSNDDDLFETSSSGKSVGDESGQSDQVKSGAVSSSNFSKILEGFSSGFVETGSKQTSSGYSPESGPNKDSSDIKDLRESPKSISSPIKLNIDPRTLLPGAKPPSKAVKSDEVIGFDKPAEPNSTLHSAAKERVKIQVKRRPQTRKARQEALRASSIEYDTIDAAIISQVPSIKNDYEQNNQISSSMSNRSPLNSGSSNVVKATATRNSPVHEKGVDTVSEGLKTNELGHLSVAEPDQLLHSTDSDKNILSDCLSANSNALSPLTDEEDLFAVPNELIFEEANNKDIPSDKNLFDGAPVLSPHDMKSSSESFSTASSFKTEGEHVSQSNLDTKLTSSTFFNEDITSEIPSLACASATTSNKSSLPSLLTPKSEVVECSESLDHQDDGRVQPPALFDEYCDNDSGNEDFEEEEDEEEEDDDDDEDLDLFSTHHRPRYQTCKRDSLFYDTYTKSSIPTDCGFKSTTQENEPRKSSFSEDLLFSPVQDVRPVKDVSEFRILPTTPENIPREPEKSPGNPSPSPKQLTFSQPKDFDELFSSAKEPKTISSFKTTEKHGNKAVEKSQHSLFDDDLADSDDLFASKITSRPRSGSRPKLVKSGKALFDDGDDDDIFSTSLSKKTESKKEELFPTRDDSCLKSTKDDDGLFSSTSSNKKISSSKPSSTQKVESFEDPLRGPSK